MSEKRKPDWLMLILGLVAGLFISFVVWLSVGEDAASDRRVGKKPPSSSQIGARPATTGAGPTPSTEPTQRPRFEFYSILPELEVVVPEEDALQDIHAESKQSAQPDSTGQQTQQRDATNQPQTDDVTVKITVDAPAGTSYYLQTGSFQRAEDAEKRKVSLLLMGLDVGVKAVSINGQPWHRVYAGPFNDHAALNDALSRLRAQNIDYMIVRARH